MILSNHPMNEPLERSVKTFRMTWYPCESSRERFVSTVIKCFIVIMIIIYAHSNVCLGRRAAAEHFQKLVFCRSAEMKRVLREDFAAALAVPEAVQACYDQDWEPHYSLWNCECCSSIWSPLIQDIRPHVVRLWSCTVCIIINIHDEK